VSLAIGALGSGSGGNCFYVAAGGQVVLVDAGFSGLEIARRLRLAGLDPLAVAGIFLTHEHGDHVHGAATFGRRHKVVVHATRGTERQVPSIRRHSVRVRHVAPEVELVLGPFQVTPFSIPHDATDPVGSLVEAEGCRIAVTTDLGHVSSGVARAWASADVLVVESNHDVDMLRLGPYPPRLKDRVCSPAGHLSNEALAGFLAVHRKRMRHLLLAHLSKVNNDPSLALLTAQMALDGEAVAIVLATQEQPSEPVRP
jgi:phosphoribosyl 1,2-cyclic phosphodiesterase